MCFELLQECGINNTCWNSDPSSEQIMGEKKIGRNFFGNYKSFTVCWSQLMSSPARTFLNASVDGCSLWVYCAQTVQTIRLELECWMGSDRPSTHLVGDWAGTHSSRRCCARPVTMAVVVEVAMVSMRVAH